MKKQNGITLLVLVVTIIVLIILAGVGINLILGESGIIAIAKKAKEEQNIANAKEKLEMEIADVNIDKFGDIKPEDLIVIDNKNGIKIKKIDGTNDIEIIDNKVTAYVDGYEFIIYNNKIYYVGIDGNFDPSDIPSDQPDEVVPNEYVQEGLVLWYDGIDNTREGHNPNSMVWENIAPLIDGVEEGTYDGMLMNIDATETSGWTENSLILDGIDDWVKMPYIYNENMTIEIVVRNKDCNIDKIQMYLSSTETGGMVLENKNGKNLGSSYIGGDYRDISSNNRLKIDQIYSLSLAYDGTTEYFRENESTYTYNISGKITNPSKSTVFAIGTNPTGSDESLGSDEERSNIEVFSVRIYNRCLTEQERENNYKLDLEKYKLEEVNNVPTASELGYVSDGLIVLYDGKYNTLSGPTNKTTIWEDLSGNSNNGTLKGFDFTNTSGWNNNALLLDGVNDWVQMKYLYNSNMTVEIVIESITNKENKTTHFICNYESGGIGIGNNVSGYNYGQIYMSGNYRKAISTSTFYCNEKYSLSIRNNELGVVFRENNNQYINEEIKSGNITKPSSSTIFAIGTNPNGSADGLTSSESRLNGYVYSVRIYNRALTDEEVQQNYNVDKARFNIQ